MEWIIWAGFILFPMIGSAIVKAVYERFSGHLAMPMKWYNEDLKKPFCTPPNWCFPIIWLGIIYPSIGYALYLLGGDAIAVNLDWRAALLDENVRLSLIFYMGQMVLNWCWTPIFFGQKLLGLGAISIWVIEAFTLCAWYWFRLVNPRAAMWLVPYICWLVFAGILSCWIWKHNPKFRSRHRIHRKEH